MYENTSRSGYARRIDAMLRARYPYLQTQLFEVAKDIFQIVFDATLQGAASISEEFHNSIRFMTVHVTLSNTRPNSYLRELSLLSDEDAMGDMGGLPLRRIDLVNLLVSRFPDAGILDVKELPENYGAAIVMKDDLAAEHEAELLQFAYALSLPIEFTISVSPSQNTDVTSVVDDPMFIWASALRPCAPSYTRADEEFWFDNIQDIAANRMPIERFPAMSGASFRCYLDLSLGEQYINLRQALLLYDEVWVVCRCENGMRPFLLNRV